MEIRNEFSSDRMETPFITQSLGHAIAASGARAARGVAQTHYERRREAKVDFDYVTGFLHQSGHWREQQRVAQ
jgi:hypothetical protein